MAKFDVFKSPLTDFPFVMEYQNKTLKGLATRVVIPLDFYVKYEKKALTILMPKVLLAVENVEFCKCKCKCKYKYEGLAECEQQSEPFEEFVLVVPQVFVLSACLLGEPTGSLIDMKVEINAALLFLVG